jgi:diguanylate cyclase (GGDEF)-like protein
MRADEICVGDSNLSISEDGRDPTKPVCVVVDAADEKTALNTALQAATSRLEAVFASASVGLIVLDGNGLIESMNPAAQEVLGVLGSTVVATRLCHVLTIRHHTDGTVLLNPEIFGEILRDGQPWNAEDVTVVCGPRSFPASCVLTPLSDTLTGAVLMLVDNTVRKRVQADLAWRARNDVLTGLINRDTFMGRLSLALTEGVSNGANAALLFIDLDRFKLINDTLGHAAGDELLMLIAARLTLAVRSMDLVSRWSGDEFVILCMPTSRSEALRISRRITKELARPFVLNGAEVHVSASIGVAFTRPDTTADSLVGEADNAMYEAKESGRSAIRVFDDESRRLTTRRNFLEQSLRAALADRQTTLAFQPQVDLTSRTIVGFELLSRWTLPDGSAVPPVEFIPIAEETGLIHDLGWHVLETAASSISRWGNAGPGLTMAANVSARQLQRPGFVERLRGLLERYGLPAGSLTLEITESVLLNNPDTALALLGRIKDLGVRLSIDDFGTGYSSLSYLRRLPVDEVKIDREFIVDLTSSSSGRTIVDAVVQMCHALGYAVVAEGVETGEQAELLGSLGCDIGQGWFFGRPENETVTQALVLDADPIVV